MLVKINLCEKEVVSFFFLVCRNGYENIVFILIEKGVDVNKCEGISFFYIVC